MEGTNWFLSWAVVTVLLLGGGMVLFQGSGEAEGYIEELVKPDDHVGYVGGVDGMHLVYHMEINKVFRTVLRNIHNGSERVLVNFESVFPDVSGDHVVFIGFLDDMTDVFLYTISSGTWIRLTNDPIIEFGPKVDRGNVVWHKDTPQKMSQIFHYHISTGVRELSSSIENDHSANVEGNMVVWESMDPGYSVIMGYDLVSDIEFEIYNDSSRSGHYPDIYADRVVYTADVNGIDLIYFFNITSKVIMWISDSDLDSYSPRIHGNNVIFNSAHGPKVNSDIWLYDLEKGALRQLSNTNVYDLDPIIWGEHVFFTRNRGHSQIFHILLDYDNDGIPDQKDMFPYNPTEIFDTDGDGLGDNIDPDNDNDGVPDEMDRFPFDNMEWSDFDGDGVGDNMDEDDDNDGIHDLEDDSPFSDINAVMDMLHLLVERIIMMEESIITRLNEIEENIAGMMEGNTAGIMEGINFAFIDLNETLSRINLSGEMEAMRINLSDLIAQEPDWYEAPDSFFDIFSQLVVEIGEQLGVRLESLMLGQNMSRQEISDLNQQIEALEEIDGIVSELEEVGRNVESQGDNLETSDSNLRTYFIVLIIVLAVYTLIMILFFVNVSRKKTVEDMDEY